MLTRRVAASLAVVALLAVSAMPATAATPAGAFDRSFGGAGYVKVPTATSVTNVRRLPSGLVAQAPSGRIYVATERWPATPPEHRWSDYSWIEVVAYTPSGALDAGFNRGRPLVVVDGSDDCCVLLGVWVTSTGGVEVGVLNYFGSSVHRYTATGRPDTSYSDDGTSGIRAEMPTSTGPMTRLPGGSIRSVETPYDATVLRGLTPAGEPDLRIGPGGKRLLPLPSLSDLTSDRYGRLFAVQVDTDADTVTAMRLSAHGATDTSWGDAGTAVMAVAGVASSGGVERAVVAETGHLYMGVNVPHETSAARVPAVVRFTPEGQPDAAWGVNGVLRVPTPSNAGRLEALAVDAEGRVLVSFVDRGAALQPYVTRLRPAGDLDPAFGSAGLLRVAGLVTAVRAIAGDRFLTVSRSGSTRQADVFLARRIG
jgi:uncharacterized delta-60 repeat protein